MYECYNFPSVESNYWKIIFNSSSPLPSPPHCCSMESGGREEASGACPLAPCPHPFPPPCACPPPCNLSPRFPPLSCSPAAYPCSGCSPAPAFGVGRRGRGQEAGVGGKQGSKGCREEVEAAAVAPVPTLDQGWRHSSCHPHPNHLILESKKRGVPPPY